MSYLGRVVRFVSLLILTLVCAGAFVACSPAATSSGGQSDDPLTGFPEYPGMSQLADRVEFEWKNLDSAYTVPDSYWAYYSVPADFLEVAAYYQVESLRMPVSNKELYWKETAGGVLSAYYQEGADTVYSRIWFIPHPVNSQESYLIIMRNNDIGGCSIF